MVGPPTLIMAWKLSQATAPAARSAPVVPSTTGKRHGCGRSSTKQAPWRWRSPPPLSDPQGRRRVDPQGVRRFLPSGPRLPAPEGTALDATTADRAGHPARRAGDRAIGESRSGLGSRQRPAARRRALVFVDESGFYLLPGKVRTYAPRGAHAGPPRVADCATTSRSWGVSRRRARIYTLMRQEALNGLHTIEFLKHLIRHVGSRLLVIWDGSPIHRRAAVEEFLASDTGRGLRVERLPPYAPDLNPVEGACATPQACRRCAILGLPRRGRTPSGTSPGRRPLETKATRDSIVLRGSGAGGGKL